MTTARTDPVLPPAVTRAWIEPAAVRTILDAYASATATEPCGLLFGREEGGALRILEAAVLPNAHASPDRAFLLTPEDQLVAARDARTRGLDLVGAWHGHVRGGPYPGYADEESAFAPVAPDVPTRRRVLLVVGRGTGGRPVTRAFVPAHGGLREIPLRV